MWMDFGHGNKRAGSVRADIGRKAEFRSKWPEALPYRQGNNFEEMDRPRNLGAAPARGEGGGRGVQLRGVELNQVVGSGGVETDKFTVDPSSRVRHVKTRGWFERSSVADAT